jgi:hypothetical protein
MYLSIYLSIDTIAQHDIHTNMCHEENMSSTEMKEDLYDCGVMYVRHMIQTFKRGLAHAQAARVITGGDVDTHTHTYIHTYIHTCTHTYIHAYTHTYMHA